MRKTVILCIAVLLIQSAFHAEGDQLDKLLDELKKNPKRHVYSKKADVKDQDMSVPEELTDEDKELDRKLKEKEKEREAKEPPPESQDVPRSAAPARSQSSEKKNWLTPEKLKNSQNSEETTENDSASWLAEELSRRQKNQEEEAQINRMVREKTKPAASSRSDHYDSSESKSSLQQNVGAYPGFNLRNPYLNNSRENSSRQRENSASLRPVQKPSIYSPLHPETDSSVSANKQPSYERSEKSRLDFSSGFSGNRAENRTISSGPVRQRQRPSLRDTDTDPFADNIWD